MKSFVSSVRYLALAVAAAALIISCGSGEEGSGSDELAAGNDSSTQQEGTVQTDGDAKPATCGNKVVDAGEQCDSYMKKCVDVDAALYTGGNALCNQDCTYDLSACVKKQETPDYSGGQPDTEVPDAGNTSDVTSGFANNPDTQCSVDRLAVCTKADFDAWTGTPMPAPENKNVRRSCFPNYWVWAPITRTEKSGCSAALCLPGEAVQFVPFQQGGTDGMCTCFNLCKLQGDQADKKPCGTGRSCVTIDDITGKQVQICGGHQ